MTRPATGFSYPIANSDGTKFDIGIDLDRDAGIFDRVILRFLKRHPEILNNRVMIVGESYGGTRATLMLQYLFNYASVVGVGPYIDLQLNNDETDYFTSVFGTPTPSAVQIQSKFGHQVLLEPVVAGKDQITALPGVDPAFPLPSCMSPHCAAMIPGGSGTPDSPPTCSRDDCDLPWGWSDNLEEMAATNLLDPAILSKAVGANVRTIEWMKASSRKAAYGRGTADGTVISAPNMNVTFGVLNAEDNYFVTLNDWVLNGYPDARQFDSEGAGLLNATSFANNLHNGVFTFISVAKHDANVWTPEIPVAIEALRQQNPQTFGQLVFKIAYDPSANNGLARPGSMSLWYNATGSDSRLVTMPHAYESGHTIPMRDPGSLLADVKQWYNNTPH